MGCWLGKAIGGTLGQSFEGMDGPLDATFYDPVPLGMVPNDDLDLQVVWACMLDGMATPSVDRELLADAWLRHVRFPFNEYGVAKRNLREGLRPPESGAHDNWFTTGEGAAIRSELWACLAPGDPALAAAFAYEDACVDHAGEGIWAPQFLAAMQAAAFTCSDIDAALDAGLGVLPGSSDVRRVVEATRRWVKEGHPWDEVRDRIIVDFGAGDFTDVRMNTGFVVLGLLIGDGDFERSILVTNNCGKDTDSSTASVGATLGILWPERIPTRWRDPIGSDLILNDAIVDVAAPTSIEDFTDLVLRLRERLERQDPSADRVVRPASQTTGLVVSAAFFSLTDEHRNLDHWFLPPAGEGEPAWPVEPHQRRLSGTWVQMADHEFDDDLLMLAYPVWIEPESAGRVRIMVAADTPCRVWLDGEWLFGRDGGPMFPAPHMPRINTYADVDLSSGGHRLTVVVQRPGRSRSAEWIVAVADAQTHEWIPGVLRGGW